MKHKYTVEDTYQAPPTIYNNCSHLVVFLTFAHAGRHIYTAHSKFQIPTSPLRSALHPNTKRAWYASGRASRCCTYYMVSPSSLLAQPKHHSRKKANQNSHPNKARTKVPCTTAVGRRSTQQDDAKPPSISRTKRNESTVSVNNIIVYAIE